MEIKAKGLRNTASLNSNSFHLVAKAYKNQAMQTAFTNISETIGHSKKFNEFKYGTVIVYHC